ncbi:MAG: hypothetical protein ABI675_12185 [Chitinophagaceae bacterium]
MKLSAQNFDLLSGIIQQERLLNDDELNIITGLMQPDFSFAAQLAMADSIHYHIHVPDIEKLSHSLFENNDGKVENKKEGYIKYGFPGGLKIIFSHIPVAQKEQSAKCFEQSYLDHIGIDIRSDNKEAYIVFQQIPLIAAQQDYFFKRQGDGVEAVKCCHMQVKEKYWVYAAKNINYEFAFGPLVIHEQGFGIDLRPANPFNKAILEDNSACCGETKTTRAKIFVDQHN